MKSENDIRNCTTDGIPNEYLVNPKLADEAYKKRQEQGFAFSERTRKQIDYAKVFDTIPCVTDGYISPIQTIASQIEMTMENETLKSVQRVGIDVDKDELIKALEYDRQQYEAGFRAGFEAGRQKAKQELIEQINGTY